MFETKYLMFACAVAAASAVTCAGFAAHANGREEQTDRGARKVFVVAMENHNWTQPSTTTKPQPIFRNPAAPFVNSLVDGTSGISDQVAFATNYINANVTQGVLANYSAAQPHRATASCKTNANPPADCQ